MKQFSLLEIISTVVLLATVVVDLSRVFHAVDSATLQVTHRCTPAPYGMLTALPTNTKTKKEQNEASAACRRA